MLDPDYLDRAGDLVGAAYGDIESDMLGYLCRLLLDGGAEGLDAKGATALRLLAQTHATELRGFIFANSANVNAAVRATVEDAIECSDRADLKAAGGASESAARTRARQVERTVQGIAAALERDNVDMVQGALSLWNREVSRAVTSVATGASTVDAAVREAVRRMAAEGITTVQYRRGADGAQTVRNAVDVAVRRHVRTQLAQAGTRRTMEICDAAGIRLVEVSSHGGARPSHARWQGRVYSLDGDVTVEGTRYRDFYRETGYGSVGGLCGANCRHSFGPYVHGAPHMYEPEPEHPSGLDGDEVYALTQGQRRRENAVRKTKRELAAAKLIAERDEDANSLSDVLRLQDRLRAQQGELRGYIDAANKRGAAPVLQRSRQREWAGDMPKVNLAASASSKRRAREVLALKEECAKKRLPIYDEGGLGAVARRAYRRYRVDRDGYSVVMHGSSKTVMMLGRVTDHKTLAAVIRARKDYVPGTPVRLLSCSTGAAADDGDCIAQRLADELGVPVTAPDGSLWVYADGTFTIGAEMGVNTGSFKTFEPRRRE